MKKKPRIPRTIAEFHPFISSTTTYLSAGTPTTNGARLNWLATEITQWTAIDTTWLTAYSKYTDETNGRTKGVTSNLKSLIAKCVKLDKDLHLLDRIAASPSVNQADLKMFNINNGEVEKAARSILQVSINTVVEVTIKQISGAAMTIKCGNSANKRTYIIEEANCVQFAYAIGDVAPVSVNDKGLEYGMSSRASFTLKLNPSTIGKKLFIYFRWHNIKHPEYSSPWNNLTTVFIL